MVKKFIFIAMLFFLVGLVGCGANNANSDANDEKQQDENYTVTENNMIEENNSLEEIVSDTGYVFQRSERSIELQSTEQFDKFVNEQDKMLVIFYGTWCPYCMDLDARIPEILEERKDLIVLNVDVDKFQQLANAYQAYTTPSVVYFQKGKQPLGFYGALPNEIIYEFLDKAEQEET